MRTAFARVVALGATAGALLLGLASPALAAETININPGNVPTTAAQFTQQCDPNLGGGPFPDLDVWVFELPGDPQTSGVFLSVTATFNTPNGTVTRTIPTDGGAIADDTDTSKAWIRLPAGWTLTGATAVITGQANFFVLTHTCAASSTPTPTPTPTQPPAPTPTVTVTPTQPPAPTATSSELPITGTSGSGSLIPLAAVGVAAVVVGVGLVALRRRRDAEV